MIEWFDLKQNPLQNGREGNISQLILWGWHYSDTKISHRYYHKKKKKHWPEFLMQMDMKILNKILANQIQNYVFKKV